MKDNKENLTPEVTSEIEIAINEQKVGNIKNDIAKKNLISEIKNGLGTMIKKEPNKIERVNIVKEEKKSSGVKRFFNNIFKSF